MYMEEINGNRWVRLGKLENVCIKNMGRSRSPPAAKKEVFNNAVVNDDLEEIQNPNRKSKIKFWCYVLF